MGAGGGMGGGGFGGGFSGGPYGQGGILSGMNNDFFGLKRNTPPLQAFYLNNNQPSAMVANPFSPAAMEEAANPFPSWTNLDMTGKPKQQPSTAASTVQDDTAEVEKAAADKAAADKATADKAAADKAAADKAAAANTAAPKSNLPSIWGPSQVSGEAGAAPISSSSSQGSGFVGSNAGSDNLISSASKSPGYSGDTKGSLASVFGNAVGPKNSFTIF